MTAEYFVATLVEYYGEYRPIAHKVVLEYAKKQYTEEELDILLRRVILEYSGQYKYPPDVAILEGIKVVINGETYGDMIGYERQERLQIGTVVEENGPFDPTPIFERLYEKFDKK